jgi:hypothetical protein
MILQILELPGHPYYVGVQFHPEFKSRPGKPSAVFLGELEIHFWVLYNCAIDWILFQMEWCFLVKKLFVHFSHTCKSAATIYWVNIVSVQVSF